MSQQIPLISLEVFPNQLDQNNVLHFLNFVGKLDFPVDLNFDCYIHWDDSVNCDNAVVVQNME